MKKFLFIIVMVVVMIMAVSGCGSTSSSTTTTSTKVTLTSISVTRSTFTAEYEGLEGDDFCITVTDNVCETIAVRIELDNPSDYDIRYVIVNGERILQADFRSDSDNELIYVLYTPDYDDYKDSITDYDTQYEYEISVTEIAVAVGIVSEYVSIGSKGSETIYIAPTFRVDLNYGLAEQYFDEEVDSTYIDITYGLSLKEATGIISEYYMSAINTELVPLGKCSGGYVFSGWYTEPDGEGLLIGYDDLFLYSSITKLYAHYEEQFTYEVISEADNTATITGLTSAGASQSILDIPEMIGEYTIIELGDYSLCQSSAYTINIYENIQVVGAYACQGLTCNIYITDSIIEVGDYAFDGCTKLSVGSALNNVQIIGKYAFRGCCWDTTYNTRTYYDTLYLNENIIYLGEGCFYQSGFTTVMVSADIKISASSMGTMLFKYSSELTNFYSAVALGTTTALEVSTGGLTAIPDYCFQYCYKLKELSVSTTLTVTSSKGVYFAEGLTSIGNYAFSGLNKEKSAVLSTITLPNSLVSIGNNAFNNSGLTNIIFTDGENTTSQLSSIGDYAFANCAMTELYLYAPSLSSVGAAIFEFNTDLINIYIYSTQVPSFSSANSGINQYLNDFAKVYVQGDLIAGYEKEWVTGSTSWTGLGDGVAFNFISLQNIFTVDKMTYAIEDNEDGTTATLVSAFQFGTSTAVTVPTTINGKTITSVGAMFAFQSLTSITFTTPENITSIQDCAFLDTELRTLDFSKLTNLVSIGEMAFEETNITSFISGSESLTYIGEDAFYRCESLTKLELITTGALQIDAEAFKYSGLQTVVLGPQIISIGSGVFAYCTDLTAVYIQSETPYTGSSITYVFQASDNVNLYYATEKIMNDFQKSTNYGSQEVPYSVKVYNS